MDDLNSSTDPAGKTLVHVPRVLIVEDDMAFAEWIQITLKPHHMLILCEPSGRKALDVYRDFRPDLVLLNIRLPDMSGWTVLDTIRESKAALSRPAIILISPYGDPANRLAAKLRDVEGYLVKPVDPETLESTVLQALGTEHEDR